MTRWKQFQSSFIISFKPDGRSNWMAWRLSLRLLLLSDQAETLKSTRLYASRFFCPIVGLNTAITTGARNLLPNHLVYIMVWKKGLVILKGKLSVMSHFMMLAGKVRKWKTQGAKKKKRYHVSTMGSGWWKHGWLIGRENRKEKKRK